MEQPAAIQARGLFRWHGSFLAVKDVSVTVPFGGRHGLIGPNGAGKTTLMRMLGTTLVPHSGSLRILGQNPATQTRSIKARIGVVPQGMTYDNEILVRENLTTFGRYHGLSGSAAAARADELLETVGLTGSARSRPEQLSGGMQRRLLIARALVNDPELILLDEPTTGLDPESRALLWELLDELCATGKTLVITTHYLTEVERLCDTVTVLRSGQVQHCAAPRQLVAAAVPPYVVELDAPRSAAAALPAWTRGRRQLRMGNRLLVFGHGAAELAGELEAAGSTELLVRPSSLDDALHAMQARAAGDQPTPAHPEPPPTPEALPRADQRPDGGGLARQHRGTGDRAPRPQHSADRTAPTTSHATTSHAGTSHAGTTAPDTGRTATEPVPPRSSAHRPRTRSTHGSPAPGQHPARSTAAPGPVRAKRPLYRPSLALARQIWWRNLTLFRKSYKTTIVPNFFEPVFSLLALGIGLGAYVDKGSVGSSYVLFVAPGLLAITAMNGAVFEVTYNVFVRLRHARSYDAAVTSPVEPSDIALGEILWSLTRCLVYTGVYAGMLAALGYAPAGRAALAVPALLPLGLVFACAGLLFTGTVRAINAYSYFYTFLLTPLTLISGVFFPIARLPGPLRALAELSPLHHGVELSRALLTRGDLAAAAGHCGWLVALAALLLGPALFALRRSLCD